MAAWPEELVERAVERDLILVVGSGVSRSCTLSDGSTRPPDWAALITDITSQLSLTRASEVSDLVVKERLLDAAELMRQEARKVGKDQDVLRYLRVALDGPKKDRYQGSPWHDAIVRMEPEVIVTTNYDKILERATNGGYSMHDYTSDHVAGDVRRRVPSLLKIHGTLDKIEQIILTRMDYTRLRVLGRHSQEVLHALLLTRPALFVGYSLRDPDMQLILENVLGGREETPPHYILASDSTPDYEVEVLKFCYGVNVVAYPSGNHAQALAMLSALADEVQASPTMTV